MKLYNNQPYVSWKTNTHTIIVQKNIKNTNNTNIQNCKAGSCKLNQSKFNARPLKHYRKEYSNINSINSNSNHSFINVFDKPGNYIVTSNNDNCVSCGSNAANNAVINIINNNTNCINSNKIYDSSKNKVICTGFNPKNLVIKTANTILDKDYCTTNSEFLKKRCKTYLKNLPLNTDISLNNGTMETCTSDNCKRTFNPSNKRYNNQGSISSSARTAALKYCNQDVNSRRCYLQKTDYNNKINLSERDSNANTQCKNNTCKKLRRINILS